MDQEVSGSRRVHRDRGSSRDGAGASIGSRDRLDAGADKRDVVGESMHAIITGDKSVVREDGRAATAVRLGEMHCAAITNGRIAKRVQGRDRDRDGLAGGGTPQRTDLEMGGSRGSHRYAGISRYGI